jgi:hypothetical protein
MSAPYLEVSITQPDLDAPRLRLRNVSPHPAFNIEVVAWTTYEAYDYVADRSVEPDEAVEAACQKLKLEPERMRYVTWWRPTTEPTIALFDRFNYYQAGPSTTVEAAIDLPGPHISLHVWIQYDSRYGATYGQVQWWAHSYERWRLNGTWPNRLPSTSRADLGLAQGGGLAGLLRRSKWVRKHLRPHRIGSFELRAPRYVLDLGLDAEILLAHSTIAPKSQNRRTHIGVEDRGVWQE